MKKKLFSTEDEIIIEVNGEEQYFTGKFIDGSAVVEDENGNVHTLLYPKLSKLTMDMVDEIEDFTGRKLLEYHQIALVYGELQ